MIAVLLAACLSPTSTFEPVSTEPGPTPMMASEPSPQNPEAPEETVMAMLAARDLSPGVAITEEDLVAIEIPPRFLSAGVFLSPEHVVGRMPHERILANEFIRDERLADPESSEFLSSKIPRGMRLLPFETSDALVERLDENQVLYADVLADGCPIVQSVAVMRARKSANKYALPAPLWVMLTPAQALEVETTRQTRSVRLSFRNASDVAFVEVDCRHEEGALPP